MGKLVNDAKDLLLGNDGSENEPDDFKVELEKAIRNGLISKADGTILITSRNSSDKLGELIYQEEKKEIINSAKDNGFESPEEEKAYKEKKKKEKERNKINQEKIQSDSLEQQIRASQETAKAKIASEKNLQNNNKEKSDN